MLNGPASVDHIVIVFFSRCVYDAIQTESLETRVSRDRSAQETPPADNPRFTIGI